MENKEFKRLQKENDRIRDTIRDIIEDWGGDKEEIFKLISELIENELEQEKHCNQ